MWKTLNKRRPQVIAHRGASGYRPEHTLEGYRLAIEQDADIVEPDLVASRDGVLYARHDLGLARSTDIANRSELAARAREMNGVRDWWISDFLAAELDVLRANQPFSERGKGYDGSFKLPRFSAMLDLIASQSEASHRRIGVYPEVKHPEYFHALGIHPDVLLIDELKSRDLVGGDSPVWLQCFNHGVLRTMKDQCGNPSFALIEELPERSVEAWLKTLQWADGIAVSKALLWDAQGNDSGLVERAHAMGFAVHAWTFREDRSPSPYASTQDELAAAYSLGVDALFCDFPDCAVRVRDAMNLSATDQAG